MPSQHGMYNNESICEHRHKLPSLKREGPIYPSPCKTKLQLVPSMSLMPPSHCGQLLPWTGFCIQLHHLGIWVLSSRCHDHRRCYSSVRTLLPSAIPGLHPMACSRSERVWTGRAVLQGAEEHLPWANSYCKNGIRDELMLCNFLKRGVLPSPGLHLHPDITPHKIIVNSRITKVH